MPEVRRGGREGGRREGGRREEGGREEGGGGGSSKPQFLTLNRLNRSGGQTDF